MPLLNYTTTVPENKTALQIQGILAAHRAKAILQEFDNSGFISALSFKAASPHGDLAIRLPIDVEATFRVLQKQRREGQIPPRYVNEAQARRIAWRIMKDWVEAQMAILETEMVRLEQIFLPYVVTKTGKTVYELMVESRFQLGEGRKE